MGGAPHGSGHRDVLGSGPDADDLPDTDHPLDTDDLPDTDDRGADDRDPQDPPRLAGVGGLRRPDAALRRLLAGPAGSRTRRPLLVGALVLTLLAGAVTALRLDPPAPPGPPVERVPGAPGGPADRLPVAPEALRLGPPPAGIVPPVLIAADRPYRIDPGTGGVHAIDLPARWRRRLVLTVTPVGAALVVQVSPPFGEPSGRNVETLWRAPSGTTTTIGFSRLVLPAPDGSGLWLVGDSGGRTVARRLGPDGAPRGTWTVPRSHVVVADTGSGLLLHPVAPGAAPVVIADPAAGWAVRQEVSGDGIAYGYAAGRVLRSGWGDGPLRVAEPATGATWPLRAWPAGVRRAGRVALSPDGRSYAVPATRDSDRATVLVLGGLDDGAPVDVVPLGSSPPPVLAFVRPDLMVGHDGARLLVVRTAPRGVWALPSVAPRTRDITAAPPAAP